MKIDTSSFRKIYHVDAEGKYAYYKLGKCSVCGKETSQCDASLLWDGIVDYICSDECDSKYWSSLVDQTEEE